MEQDTAVLWSKLSTLDQKFEESNPSAANFSVEVEDLDVQRKKKKTKKKQARRRTTIDARARSK